MLKIRLKAEFNELKVKEYEIFYPLSIYTNKKSQRNTEYTVASLHCDKIQGSFLLFYSRKINISKIQKDDDEIDVVGGKIHSSKNVKIKDDDTALQYLMFQKRLLVYVNEHDSNSYLNERTNILPAFLMRKVDDVKDSVQFWLEYSDGATLKSEEIIIYLNLKHEQ